MRQSWATYWREVCAPKLKRRKEELGRAVPEREIAAAVEAASGKNSERGLVSLWLLGKREPYISQFFALCDKLALKPDDVLDLPSLRSRHRQPAIRRSEKEIFTSSRKPDSKRAQKIVHKKA